jgi:hypothetical protein
VQKMMSQAKDTSSEEVGNEVIPRWYTTVCLLCLETFFLDSWPIFTFRRGPSSLAGKSKITNPNESDHFCMGPRNY